MPGVGAQHQQVGAARLDLPGGSGEHRGRLVPGAGSLELLDLSEVDRDKHAAGPVQAS